MKRDLNSIDKQIDELMDLLADSDSKTVVKAYERKIQRLENTKFELREQLANMHKPQPYKKTLKGKQRSITPIGDLYIFLNSIY